MSLPSSIIHLFRTSILQEVRDLEDYDAWDEGSEGALWLANELSLFDQLYHALYPSYQPRNWDDYSTVFDVQTALTHCSDRYLHELAKFARHHGSRNPNLYALRNLPPEFIRNTFALLQ